MSKELEALENIIETFYDKDSEDIQIVRKALEELDIIRKAYSDYANYKISEYELIMIVGDKTTY